MAMVFPFFAILLSLQCLHQSLSAPLDFTHPYEERPQNFPSGLNDVDKGQELLYNFPAKLSDVVKRQECVDKRNCTWVRVVYHLNTQKKLEDFCEEYKVLRLIKECQKTCGHCKPPAPPAPEPLECKDERDCSFLTKLFNGDRAKLDDYCDLHKEKSTIKQCRRTCGFCKAPAPKKECKDERSDCKQIIEINKGNAKAIKEYCEYHLAQNDTAVSKCKKTCGACGKAPHPPGPVECKDDRNDCNWIVENNKGEGALEEYCRVWKNSAGVQGCKKTCGLCKAPSPPKLECKDERSDCNKIIEINKGNAKAIKEYCEYHLAKNDTAVSKCKKTCGACGKAPHPPGPAVACEDTRRGGCSWIKNMKDSEGYCKAWKEDEAVKQCRKTCGFCK